MKDNTTPIEAINEFKDAAIAIESSNINAFISYKEEGNRFCVCGTLSGIEVLNRIFSLPDDIKALKGLTHRLDAYFPKSLFTFPMVHGGADFSLVEGM